METTSLPPDDRPPVAGPRRVNRGLLWAVALAVVVLAIATVVAFVAGDGGDDGTVKLDPDATQAPDGGLNGTDITGAALPDVTYTTFDDAVVRLTTGGKPLLINFWASTCVPCVTEMPDLERSFQANGQAVGFLGIQVAESPDAGTEMIGRTGITYPVGRDPRGSVFQAFGGVGLPRTVLVRADGTIAYVHTGPLDATELQQAIDEHAVG